MTAPLLALLLSVADPLGFPPVGGLAAAVAPTTTPPATPTATTTAAPAAPVASTAAPALTLPATGPGLANLALPGVALALLAVVTLIFSRRKKQESRLVRVLETTALGPKRSLVVARLGDELLVIGASESGLQLLAARPAFDDLGEAARLRAVPDLAAATAAAPAAPAEHRQNPLVAALGRLRGAASRGAPAEADAGPERATFDALLAESAEDLELRRKLARGQSGSVR